MPARGMNDEQNARAAIIRLIYGCPAFKGGGAPTMAHKCDKCDSPQMAQWWCACSARARVERSSSAAALRVMEAGSMR